MERFLLKAGHWVQQEQSKKTFDVIKNFYSRIFEMSVLNIIKMGHPTLRKKAKKVLLKDFAK